MIKRTRVSNAVAAAFLAMSAQLAFAVQEAEPVGTMGANDSLGTAQQLTLDSDGKVIVQGAIGTTNPAALDTELKADVDFYSFEGFAGNSVTVDIDDGMKAVMTTTRHVDTIVALYKPGAAPGTWELVVQFDNMPTIDEGSQPVGGERDARIDPVRLEVDGTYIVGVSSSPRFFTNEGLTKNPTVLTPPNARFPNGSYTLIISGVTPPPRVQYVNIDIKPGDRDEVTRLHPKMKRDIPIALLSNAATASGPAFNALEVKVDSITFGRGGEEKSLVRCLKHGRDVNRDGLRDLICLFDVPSAAFQEDDLVGKMKGESANGMRFEAAAKLKVKAPRRKHKEKHDHRDDDDDD